MHVCRCHRQHAGKFHKDAAGFAYSYNFSFNAFERTILDHHGLPLPELLGDLRQVDQVIVEGGGYGDEVFHGLGRDGERGVGGTVPVVVDRAGVTEAADVEVEGLAGREGEDQAADGWDELLLPPHHRDEGADALFLKGCLDLELPGVGSAEDVPALLRRLMALK